MIFKGDKCSWYCGIWIVYYNFMFSLGLERGKYKFLVNENVVCMYVEFYERG